MMTHERFRELLSDYLEQSLTGEGRLDFEAHLGQCPGCARMAESFLETVRDLRAFPWLEVPPGFTTAVLERTSRRPAEGGFWEGAWIWLRFPHLTPLAAAILLALPLMMVAGTQDGRHVARKVTMATHQTYSNAVRLYRRSEDLRAVATAVGERIPGQLEDTVGWIRQRLGGRESENPPRPRPEGPDQQSFRAPGPVARA